MIARMSKYNFVLYAAQSEDFIEKLRGLGLVDITTTGWELSLIHIWRGFRAPVRGRIRSLPQGRDAPVRIFQKDFR